jgi:shikimate kinase
MPGIQLQLKPRAGCTFDMAFPERIYLTGLPGSGKTTLARQFALAEGYQFVDLDEQIAEAEGMPVTEIFSQRGENYFRNKETMALQQTLAKVKSIVATGGGTPCFNDNINTMKRNGVMVFLDVPLEAIAQRMNEGEVASRPLFAGSASVLQKLEQLSQARRSFYLQADIVLAESECNENTFKKKVSDWYQQNQS